MGLGCIPLARYGTPGTFGIGEDAGAVRAALRCHSDVESRRGDLRDTIEHAYMKMETVEHFAQIALVTHLLGRQQPLTGVDVEKLMLARTKYFGAR